MMIENEWLSRTELLIGLDNIHKLRQSHVIIFGLGGVGAYTAEQLCRSGIGELTLVDGDSIQPTNLNRQLLALNTTIGKPKTEAISQRLHDINPKIKINIINKFVTKELKDILFEKKYDYVVDAIDTLSPKIHLIRFAVENRQPLVSSLGSGGKIDPTQISIADISKSYNCKLGFVVRKRLRRFGISSGFKVVFSTEKVNKDAVKPVEEFHKKSMVGTISYIPAIFGCFAAAVVIRDLIQK